LNETLYKLNKLESGEDLEEEIINSDLSRTEPLPDTDHKPEKTGVYIANVHQLVININL